MARGRVCSSVGRRGERGSERAQRTNNYRTGSRKRWRGHGRRTGDRPQVTVKDIQIIAKPERFSQTRAPRFRPWCGNLPNYLGPDFIRSWFESVINGPGQRRSISRQYSPLKRHRFQARVRRRAGARRGRNPVPVPLLLDERQPDPAHDRSPRGPDRNPSAVARVRGPGRADGRTVPAGAGDGVMEAREP